jgi:hypothetical protein
MASDSTRNTPWLTLPSGFTSAVDADLLAVQDTASDRLGPRKAGPLMNAIATGGAWRTAKLAKANDLAVIQLVSMRQWLRVTESKP